MDSLSIVFMGTPDFALPALSLLLPGPHRVVAAVTRPDAPQGRGRHLAQSPVKTAALAAGLPVLQPVSLREPGFLAALESLGADLFVVVAFRILPPEVLAVPKKGAVNLHASLLPAYRGAAPVQWAIVRGETRTGVTVFFLDRNVDTGAIIRQEPIDIGPDENAGELSARLSGLGARVLLDSVHAIASGAAQPRPQDNRLASPAPKLSKEDGKIDFTRSAREIYNWIRGFTPAPGAFAELNGQRIQFLGAECLEGGRGGRPGKVLAADKKGLLVQTGDGRLRVTSVKPQNRKAMSAADFLNGFRINENDAFNL